MRVLIACGGTGGHLFPGIAVAEELHNRGHSTMLLVSRKTIDHQALSGREDLQARALPSMGWPGLFSPKIISFAMELWKGQKDCAQLFREFQPEAVIGMGGFISAVPLWMGKKHLLPLFLHESNVVPGKVTRLMAGTATRVLLGFGKCAESLNQATCVVTGTPVRSGLKRLDPAQARREIGLDPSRKTLLIMGGSQGASGINRLFVNSLSQWTAHKDQWQFVHLTGATDCDHVRQAYQAAGFTALVEPFSQKMAHLYSAADGVVSRSGAASLTEISYYGLPSILIPFPQAADNHQLANAQLFEKAGASLVWEQHTLQPETFAPAMAAWLQDEVALQAMRQASGKLSVKNAASCVANEVELCRKS